MKIHVGIDVTSKKIVSLKITDERSHDAQHLPAIVEQASRHGKVVKTLADAAYDSKNNFSHLYHNNVAPGIKVRKNSSGRSRGCYPRKVSEISLILFYAMQDISILCASHMPCLHKLHPVLVARCPVFVSAALCQKIWLNRARWQVLLQMRAGVSSTTFHFAATVAAYNAP